MTRSRLLVGLVLITVGGLLLTELAVDLDAWSIIRDWWPVVLIAAGLLQLATTPRNPIGGVKVATPASCLLMGRRCT